MAINLFLNDIQRFIPEQKSNTQRVLDAAKEADVTLTDVDAPATEKSFSIARALNRISMFKPQPEEVTHLDDKKMPQKSSLDYVI